MSEGDLHVQEATHHFPPPIMNMQSLSTFCSLPWRQEIIKQKRKTKSDPMIKHWLLIEEVN